MKKRSGGRSDRFVVGWEPKNGSSETVCGFDHDNVSRGYAKPVTINVAKAIHRDWPHGQMCNGQKLLIYELVPISPSKRARKR